MIEYKGKGYLVAAVGFLLALGTEYATEAWSGDASYYQTHGWPLAAVLLTAGAASWLIGSYLHRKGSRVVIDKATGREETVGGDDTFFFVPIRFWGPILAAIAIGVLYQRGL